MKVVSTKLSNPEWERVVDKCNERGLTMAEYLRELIKNDSGDKTSVEDVQENKKFSELELEQLLQALAKEKSGKDVLGTSEPKKSPFAQQSNAYNGQCVIPRKTPCIIIKDECAE